MVGNKLTNVEVFTSISATKILALVLIAALVDSANTDELLIGTASWCEALAVITSTFVAWAASIVAIDSDHLLVSWTLWLLGNTL